MKSENEYIVKTEKMINEGKGLAKINGLPVFIDGACTGDELKIKINKINKSYLSAEIIDIIVPSPYRIKPKCALSKVCGSCNWQHIDYSRQLIEKRNILEETLQNIAGISIKAEDTIESPKVYEYRCKVQMPVAQTKVSKRILSGYYKKNSHELVNIKYCPMQCQLINDINEYIKNNIKEFNIDGYSEENHKGLLRHIIYRISSDNKSLLIIFVLNSDCISKEVKIFSEKLKEEFQEIIGICANFNTKKTNVILGNVTEKIVGNDYYIEKLNGISYRVSAGSFFQVNPYCAELIFEKVKKLISERISNPSILDAYSGVSSFGIWLSEIASNVVSVETVKSASEDALYNVKINNITNLQVINGEAEKIFSDLINKKMQFDVSVIDPPRKGCDQKSLETLVKLTKNYIVYISCNPATLARDIKILSDYGYIPEYVQPADMFPNTAHIETIALLKKSD